MGRDTAARSFEHAVTAAVRHVVAWSRPGDAAALRLRAGAAVVLLGAGLVTGGLPGAVLLLAGCVAALDAALPVPAHTRSEADLRFTRLARARRRASRLRRLTGRATVRLDVLDDTRGWPSTAPRRPLGVCEVPLDAVTGTVEAVKAAAFDAAFRPDEACRGRWTRLWLARARGESLPPIEVYRVGGAFFVRDGHHRVSVARDHGATVIDANVVALLPSHPRERRRTAAPRVGSECGSCGRVRSAAPSA